MRVMIQFSNLLPSAFLSFHEPSEEFMKGIRMAWMDGIK
jgi:hypothetical protein